MADTDTKLSGLEILVNNLPKDAHEALFSELNIDDVGNLGMVNRNLHDSDTLNKIIASPIERRLLGGCCGSEKYVDPHDWELLNSRSRSSILEEPEKHPKKKCGNGRDTDHVIHYCEGHSTPMANCSDCKIPQSLETAWRTTTNSSVCPGCVDFVMERFYPDHRRESTTPIDRPRLHDGLQKLPACRCMETKVLLPSSWTCQWCRIAALDARDEKAKLMKESLKDPNLKPQESSWPTRSHPAPYPFLCQMCKGQFDGFGGDKQERVTMCYVCAGVTVEIQERNRSPSYLERKWKKIA